MSEAKPVETVEKTLVVGKECGEVFDALKELILDIRAGKDVGMLAAENLAGLMVAVDGYEQLGPEIKHESRSATLGYGVAQIGSALDTEVTKVS